MIFIALSNIQYSKTSAHLHSLEIGLLLAYTRHKADRMLKSLVWFGHYIVPIYFNLEFAFLFPLFFMVK